MDGPLHPSFWPTFPFLFFFPLIPPNVRYAHGLGVSHTLFILLHGWTTTQLSCMNRRFPVEVATARHAMMPLRISAARGSHALSVRSTCMLVVCLIWTLPCGASSTSTRPARGCLDMTPIVRRKHTAANPISTITARISRLRTRINISVDRRITQSRPWCKHAASHAIHRKRRRTEGEVPPLWDCSSTSMEASVTVRGCSLGHTDEGRTVTGPTRWPEPNQFLVGLHGGCR
jgi:hypothetical protein